MPNPTAGQLWLAYNDAANRDDFAAMAAAIAPDLAVTENGRPGLASAEEDARAMRQLRFDYPDYRRDVVDLIDAGDRAAIRWWMHGTPRLPGQPVLDVAGCSVIKVAGGVITEAHLYSPASITS